MEGAYQQFLKPNTLLDGRYQLVSALGSGATGTVFLAEDQNLNSEALAIKILHPHLLLSDESYSRFRAETRITMRLSHPNILTCFGMGQHGNQISFLKMEYCDGTSLADLIDRKPQHRKLTELICILRDIASALEYAHLQGVIHRDLKPENILIGEDREVRVADFGIAQIVRQEARLTGQGDILGTPYYMSPEQLRSELIDGRSDMYSFGIMAYEVITGQLPFTADSFWELAELHISAPLPVEPLERVHTPPWLIDLVAGCVEKDRHKRLNSMSEIYNILEQHCPLEQSPDRDRKRSPSFLEQPSQEESSKFVFTFQKNYDRVVRYSFSVFILLVLFLAPRINSSVDWRYNIVAFRIERIFGVKLPWVRKLMHVPAHISYPESMFGSGPEFKHETLSLLKAGYEVNVYSESRGEYPIHYVVYRFADCQIVRYLVEYGALVNVSNRAGQTPLFIAVLRGEPETVEFLLSEKADPNIATLEGLVPLSQAAKSSRYDIARSLLEQSRVPIDVNRADLQNQTPLHFAVPSGHRKLVELLLTHGADPTLVNDDGDSPLTLAKSLQPRKRYAAVIELLEKQSVPEDAR